MQTLSSRHESSRCCKVSSFRRLLRQLLTWTILLANVSSGKSELMLLQEDEAKLTEAQAAAAAAKQDSAITAHQKDRLQSTLQHALQLLAGLQTQQSHWEQDLAAAQVQLGNAWLCSWSQSVCMLLLCSLSACCHAQAAYTCSSVQQPHIPNNISLRQLCNLCRVSRTLQPEMRC